MAKLLVSVRSVVEARAAVAGGADLVDIKEPRLGPLGQASRAVWRAVRAAVPPEIPVSVALGELAEFDQAGLSAEDFIGIAFRKVGPAGLGRGWHERWDRARHGTPGASGWVAVAYADWEGSASPDPDTVIEAALKAEDCPGVLIDTWDKSTTSPLSASPAWADRIALVQRSGRFVALAGGLDQAAIRRLAPLHPDLFAVRGAACLGQRRAGMVRADRVAELVATLRETTPMESQL